MSTSSVERNRDLNGFMERNRLKYSREIMVRTCKYCGENYVTFKRVGRPLEYCSDECRENARLEQSRVKACNWYHRHKHRLDEIQRYGLGTGYLGGHRNTDFEQEYKTIRNEFGRLKIK